MIKSIQQVVEKFSDNLYEESHQKYTTDLEIPENPRSYIHKEPIDYYNFDIPLFVYGTLKEGYGNGEYCMIRKGIHPKDHESGIVKGALLSSSGVPFMHLQGMHSNVSENHVVLGEIWYINKYNPEVQTIVRRSVDSLEGFSPNEIQTDFMFSGYLRDIVNVYTESGNIIQAYAYVVFDHSVYEKNLTSWF